MGQQRIKGQETAIVLVQDNAPSSALKAVTNFDFTWELESLREGYLGETSDRTDSIFNVVTFSCEAHMQDTTVLALAGQLVAKAKRAPGAATRIDIVVNYLFPDGSAMQVVLIDVAFGNIPASTASRSDYVSVSLEGECSDFLLLPL